jgi:predicted ATPase
LAQAVAPLDLLLALDNAEHLLDAVAGLACSLLSQAPRLRVLVTSQAPLRVGGEWLYRLGALAIPAGPCTVAQALGFGAVALFDQRARAVDRHFQIDDDNLPMVVELCRRLDGTPLAIELAAQRLPLMGLPALVAALDRPLQVLTAGARGAQPRHRSLRAALTWSHRLLSPTEQQVFRRLAVFEVGVPLARAQRVLADRPWTPHAAPGLCETQVLEALSVLVERSLVVLTEGVDAPMLGLPCSARALAVEALHASGEKAELLQRHACS